MRRAFPWLVVGLLIGFSFGACLPTADGSMPATGECKGPEERAFVRMARAEQFNSGCNASQVHYYQDNDPNQPRCGQCEPGTSGAEDESSVCKLNEFCNDAGLCQDTKTSPLYNEPCPYEQGGHSADGWCGPGLRCIRHSCLPCLDGVEDPRDGKICINDHWTYSRWSKASIDPEFYLLCIITGTLLLRTVIQILIIRREDGSITVIGYQRVRDMVFER